MHKVRGEYFGRDGNIYKNWDEDVAGMIRKPKKGTLCSDCLEWE